MEIAEEMILVHVLYLAITLQVTLQQLLNNGGCLSVQQLQKHKGIPMLENSWTLICRSLIKITNWHFKHWLRYTNKTTNTQARET